jgi:predicted acetyltransferase
MVSMVFGHIGYSVQEGHRRPKVNKLKFTLQARRGFFPSHAAN